MQAQFKAIALCAAAITATSHPAVADIDAGLEDILRTTPPGEIVSALVYLWDQGDIATLAADHRQRRVPFAHRNKEVVRTLQDTAALTQVELRDSLAVMRDHGAVESYEPFWIANAIRVDATEPVLRAIAARPDVKIVFFNMPISNIQPELAPAGHSNPQPIGSGSPEIGVQAIGAPEVWDMGYTGEGVLIATMDSGADGNHPALASRWRGLHPLYEGNPEWAWFDPITFTTSPQEFAANSHGTHTLGTVLGGAPGDQIGVAPGAQWISAGVIDRGGFQATIANAIGSFQWMASPTGNPADWWAVPRVCSNSWGTVTGHGHPNCDQTFWVWIDNSEAAGTAQIFSAGNEGSGGLRRPADRATSEYHSMAVGGVDANNPNWPVYSASSLGPTLCTPDGGIAIKPDIAAPAVSVRSAISGGGYNSYSGTSMASPHVNGVMALMLQACDFLTADELKQIIYDTAFDLGAPGKDNTFGWGMIDAVQAVTRAIDLCTIGLRLPDGAPSLLDPGVSTSFTVEVLVGNESPVPGSEMLFYRVNGGEFESVPLIGTDGGIYQAIIPAPSCDQVLDYYVQVVGNGGTVRTSPADAPLSLHTAHVGDIETIMALDQSFSAGVPSGWTASGLWNVTSACQVAGSCPGDQWAYYGHQSTCTYQTGNAPNAGELVSVAVEVPQIPPLGFATVSFCYNLQTEPAPNFDIATFSIDGVTSTILPNAPQWTTYSIDVTELAGETITLRWHFDTLDGVSNNFRGWQIDNVKVTITGLACSDPKPVCPSDLNGDNVVDVSDLLLLLGSWGSCSGCTADLNSDGFVDVSDLLILFANWGEC